MQLTIGESERERENWQVEDLKMDKGEAEGSVQTDRYREYEETKWIVSRERNRKRERIPVPGKLSCQQFEDSFGPDSSELGQTAFPTKTSTVFNGVASPR